MKRYLYFLFALLVVNFSVRAQNEQMSFGFLSQTIPAQGGTVEAILVSERPHDGMLELRENLPLTITSYTNDPQLISVTNNGKGVFYFEFMRNTTGKSISRSIVVSFDYEGIDEAAGGRPIPCSGQASLHYTQDTASPTLFRGGVIECDTNRIYKIGELPPVITSKEDAAYPSFIIVDGQIIFINPGSPISYAWEKKTESDPLWRTLPGKTESTCQPTVMDDRLVYYRRKAICGKDVLYSNTIVLEAQITHSAGVISYALNDNKMYLTLYHTSNPTTSQTRFEQSADLKNWSYLETGTPVTERVPDGLTYYRSVAIDADGNEYYSNIINYIPLPSEPNLSQDQNYVNTRTYKGNYSWTDKVKYYDGLGQLNQQVDVSASPSGRDIVTPSYYDNMGRNDARVYLPYNADMPGGEYRAYALDEQANYYQTNYSDFKSYSGKIYELSPLNRVVAQMNVGDVFDNNNKKIQLSYLANTPEDGVLRFTVDNLTNKLNVSYYDTSTLYKNISINEDGTTAISFVDMFDREILKRVIADDNIYHDTYSVYDDFGRLAWVLPPQAIAELQTNLPSSLATDDVISQNYCYIYKFDGRNRCIERKLPGKDWEYLVYDKADRLVLSQDGNLRMDENGTPRPNPQWLYNVYDNLNRPVSTSLVEQQVVLTRQEIQNRYNAPEFDDSYPILGGSADPYKPFDDNSFNRIAVLTENKYDINNLRPQKEVFPKVIISEIFYDVPINNQDTPGSVYRIGEFIEFYNCDSTEVDLTGWTLIGNSEDEIFTFPAGTKILAGGYMILTNQHDNILLTLSELPDGAVAPPDKLVIYQQKISLDDTRVQLTFKDAAGNIKDSINTTKPNRLPAPDEDNTPAIYCESIQRVKVLFDVSGCAVSDNLHWIVGRVTPFLQQAQFIVEDIQQSSPSINNDFDIPDYLSPKPVSGIVDKDVIDYRTIGLKVYEKTAVLHGGDYSNVPYIERAYYYDYKGRAVQVVEKNQFGGISRTSSKYDFTGNKVASCESHQPDPHVDAFDVLKTYYTYDFQDRLLNEMTVLNGCEPELIEYDYDELGKLKSKTYGGGTENETIPVIPKSWLSFSPDVNELSDLFRDYVAERIEMDYGITDWRKYEYIMKDGSINPDYLMIQDNGTAYYYFPNMEDLQGKSLENVWADIFQPFQYEYGLSCSCYNLTREAPDWIPWKYEITVPKQKPITETYNYNIQGWQTEQYAKQGDNTLFYSQLHYYDPQNGGTASYTGNITEWTWQNGLEAEQNTYAFTYDKLSRLKETGQYINGNPEDRYIEKGLSYDRNSNITAITRTNDYSDEVLDFKEYRGNQLITLHKRGPDYTYEYDSNGNMTKDGAYDLDLSYNHLNLLENVKQSGATIANYSYLADNTKLSATNASGDGLYYLGSLVYGKQGNRLSLESAGLTNGRLIVSTGGVETRYFITDHLGSVRTVIDKAGQALEVNDYYPFGLRWETGQLSDNRYRYNAKEEQGFVNVPYIDYGARQYDPTYRLQWNGVDMLAKKHPAEGTHVFCGNNPIKFMDPDGRDRRIIINNKNKTITVQATFYHNINTGTYVRSGVQVFNNMRDVSYTDKNGTQFKVTFDLSTTQSSDPKNAAEKNPAGNYFEIADDLGTNNEGRVVGKGGGKAVKVLQEYKDDSFVTAHEMGHALGAAMSSADGKDNHAPEGLMVKTVNDSNKSLQLDQKSVDEIMEQGTGPKEEKKPNMLWNFIMGWFIPIL